MPTDESKINLGNLPHSVGLDRDESGRMELTLIDQRALPQTVTYIRTHSWEVVVDAIKTLAVRGAPAIGVSGASALALWADDPASDINDLDEVANDIANARPTAVNLSWAVRQARDLARRILTDEGVAADGNATKEYVAKSLFGLVKQMEVDDEATNRAIGAHGAALLGEGTRVLTHCNAGSLGTVFYGTALGVVYAAAEQGKIERVYADETRPVGQGARLTTWELSRVGVPVTLICDNMAASLMAKGKVDVVFVGADRVTLNGDAANKIGTYGVAVLAKHHGIPFYVCVPFSTIDASLADGSLIPIEQRDASEVLPVPLDGVDVWNPAFDVTPAELITGIVTERGVFKPGELSGIIAGQ